MRCTCFACRANVSTRPWFRICASTPRSTASPQRGQRRLEPNVPIMHPGPMNRGVEIAADVPDLDQVVVVDQVRNGVAVRMAVLFLLLGSGSNEIPDAP